MADEQATFGAGCFWGAEAAFRLVDGVKDARVGYATGSDGSTAPARIEVVQIDFDPAKVSYADLIKVFWTLHDPFSVDRQGPYKGPLVRSAIFAHSDVHAATARREKSNLTNTGNRTVATQIIPYASIELAEERHQRYLEKEGLSSCSMATADTLVSAH